MTSYLTCGLIAICGLLCAVAEPVAQQNYDGRNGPHVFGRPGEQVYIRGQNEGAYNVPGVGGTFQNAPSRGEHVYTDERGNTFVNHRNGAGPATHSINGPNLVASRGGQGGAVGPGPLGPPGRRNVYVGPNGGISATRPDGRTASIGGHRRRRRNDGAINRNRRDSFSVGRPDRGVDFSTGPGGSDFSAQRNRRDTFSVGRPDRGVDYSTGPGGSDFSVQRNRRSPQIGQVTRPDGRQVSYSPGSIFASGTDGRTVQQYDRRRRAISDARVTGENFAARDDRAGVWNDNGTSVWRRPDGRTVTTDRDGNVITSGSPNGRGPQHYSG